MAGVPIFPTKRTTIWWNSRWREGAPGSGRIKGGVPPPPPPAPAARPDHRPHPPPATDPTGEIKGTIKGSEPLIPNNPLEKTASYRRRPVSRWLIIPRESGTTSRYCPLRGVFFLLDSGLRRNDELMDCLG